MFEEAADFTSGEIKAYRKFVFPDALAAPDHDLFFSVENAPSWITSRCTTTTRVIPIPSGHPTSCRPYNSRHIEAINKKILSDQYVGHSYFSLESPESSSTRKKCSVFTCLLAFV
ncbi:hypothetical protein B0H10DRAFT_1967837 [Mycena sp. CBHHK59/15]|nr:hypothetical protein B0H10DRAFT_1967837 [Mycena sp. CBHHK59/15]